MREKYYQGSYSIILFILIFLILLEFKAYSQEEVPSRRVAVLNFSANNTSEGISRIVRNQVEIFLFKTEYFDILERNQINIILKERKKQASECNDESCAAKIGKILSANFVVIGSVDKLDNFIITIKVVSVKEKRVIIADFQETDKIGDLRKITGAVTRRVAEKIRVNASGDKTGPLLNVPLHFSILVDYIEPSGYLKDKVNTGYGISFTGGLEDIFISNFVLGLEVQYINFSGKDNLTHHAVMIPVMLRAGYRFNLWKFSLLPQISSGVSYNTLYYYKDSNGSDYYEDSKIQPIAKAGFVLEFTVMGSFRAQLGAGYGSVFEKDGRVGFISYSAGAAIRF